MDSALLHSVIREMDQFLAEQWTCLGGQSRLRARLLARMETPVMKRLKVLLTQAQRGFLHPAVHGTPLDGSLSSFSRALWTPRQEISMWGKKRVLVEGCGWCGGSQINKRSMKNGMKFAPAENAKESVELSFTICCLDCFIYRGKE